MATIIAIANQKGGVAKTTTAVTLAHGLSQRNYNVLLADLDPQGQCASFLGMEQEPGVFNLLVTRLPMRDIVRSTGRENLWLLPGSKRTETAQYVLNMEDRRKDVLTETLSRAGVNSGRTHYIVLDTAPAVGLLQANALYAADVLILPAATDWPAIEGVAEILKSIEALERPTPPTIRILPTFYDSVTKESKANLRHLQDTFSDVVLEPIHRATILRECAALGKTVLEHAPLSRAAKEYMGLVWGIIDG